MQLDIFDHSRDTMLRNDVVHAVERHDAIAAGSAWQILVREFPDDASAALLGPLVRALERVVIAAFTDHDALQRARHALHHDIEPAANRMLGAPSAATWLASMWRLLAQRAAVLEFAPDRDEDHAVPMWLRAGDWATAAEAVARIASWRRIPAPLGWMAESRLRRDGLDAALALLAELAWLSPGRLDELTQRVADPRLENLRSRFDAVFEGDGNASDMAWFPAWVLTEKPGMAPLLDAAQRGLDSAPEQAMRLLLELLRLERQGRHHAVVARRKVLRDLQPSLYAAYLATR